MIRQLLVLYLTLTAAAEPLFCCCAAELLPAPGPCAGGVLSPGRHPPACACCDCRARGQGRTRRGADSPAPASDRSCPCRLPAVLSPAAGGSAKEALRLSSSLDSSAGAILPQMDCGRLLTGPGSPPVRLVAGPARSARDLLFVLQTLRC